MSLKRVRKWISWCFLVTKQMEMSIYLNTPREERRFGGKTGESRGKMGGNERVKERVRGLGNKMKEEGLKGIYGGG